MIVMIDTCVVLDYLLDREPFVYDVEKLLVKVAEEEIQGLITVKSLMDIHYILKHTLHKEEKVRDTITTLLDSLMLVDSTAEDAIRALSSRITDYEDALMVETANLCNCDRIITRNKKDYKNTNVLVMTPAEFLKRNMQ